jgi:hypothetical protein
MSKISDCKQPISLTEDWISLKDYISKNDYKIIKPHGSVNWVRELTSVMGVNISQHVAMANRVIAVADRLEPESCLDRLEPESCMNVSEDGTQVHITWRSDDEEDVREAREFFAKQARQSWIAAKKDGEYKRVLEFEPEYELWFFPIVEGG